MSRCVVLLIACLSLCASHAVAQNFAWEKVEGPTACEPRSLISTSSGALLLQTTAGIFRTPHPDSSWTRVSISLYPGPYDNLQKADDGTVYCNSYYQYQFRSLDDGQTWSQIDLQHANGSPIIAAADSGRLLLTYHGYDGIQVVINQELKGSVYSSELIGSDGVFTNDGAIIAAGREQSDSTIKVLRSIDSGRTWGQVIAPLGRGAVGGLVKSGPDIYLAATNGLFRSTDNGLRWSSVNSNYQFNKLIASCDKLLADISSLYSYDIWAISRDQGITWDTISGVSPFTKGYYVTCDNLFGFDPEGVAQLDDSTKTWERRNKGLKGAIVQDLQIDSAGYLWLATNGPSYGSRIWCVKHLDWKEWAILPYGYSDVPSSVLPGGYSWVLGLWGSSVKLTNNRGQSWDLVGPGSDNNIHTRLRSYFGRQYLAGGSGAWMSANWGIDWTYLPGPDLDKRTFDLCVAPNGRMYFLRQNGIVATETGADWRTITSPIPYYEEEATISYDPFRDHLYLLRTSAREKDLKVSTDDGATWIMPLPERTDVWQQPIFAPDGRIFVKADRQNYTSTDGLNFEELTDTVLATGSLPSFYDGYIYVSRGHELFRAPYAIQSSVNRKIVNTTLQVIDGRLEVSQAQQVTVEVFDLKGSKVQVLYDQMLQPGSYELKPQGLESGYYLTMVKAKGFEQSVKIAVQ